MKIRFWGTRGSVAASGSAFVRYGGNTSCVEIETDAGTRLIFDAGTGLRGLGDHLIRAANGPLRAHLFLTHTHWDHIQGLPYFKPADDPENQITVYAVRGLHRSLEDLLRRQRRFSCGVPNGDANPPALRFRTIDEGTYQLEEGELTTQFLNHTTVTIGYRLTIGGVTVVYSSDHEPFARNVWRPESVGRRPTVADAVHEGDRLHVELARDADVLIHDAQYTAAEYPQKIGWGHSTVEYATEVALAANCGRLFLFHHDHTHPDELIDRLAVECRDRARALGGGVDIDAAREGDVVHLSEGRSASEAPRLPPTRPVGLAKRILIADDLPELLDQLEALLREDGYDIVRARDGEEALNRARAEQPDMVILDVMMPKLDGFAVCKALRTEPATESIPIVILTTRENTEDMERGFAAGVTDYVLKPLGAGGQLRARVRQWLLRKALPA